MIEAPSEAPAQKVIPSNFPNKFWIRTALFKEHQMVFFLTHSRTCHIVVCSGGGEVGASKKPLESFRIRVRGRIRFRSRFRTCIRIRLRVRFGFDSI